MDMKRYKEIKPIGEIGAFGYVSIVKEIIDGKLMDEEYVMKKLKLDDEDSIKRFKNEVRILKSLNHPRVMKVLGYKLDDDKPLYIMPLYKESLKSKIPSIVNNYQDIKEILNSILDGVEYLHNEGIIHRDLKPQNILINTNSDLVISDLGLGLKLDSDSTRLTLTGTTMGTQCYMSPEQIIDAKHIDHKSDIFSIGKIIYECFTNEIGYNIDTNKLPNGIRFVVSKCLETNKEKRYSNINELRNSLNAAIDTLIYGEGESKLENLILKLYNEESYKEAVDTIIEELKKVDLKSKEDLIHKMIMTAPRYSIIRIMKSDQLVVNEIISVFADHVKNQSWGFNYTDDLCVKCKSLYKETDEVDIKAKLIFCLIHLGIWHNRYYVMDVSKELLYSVKDSDLALAIVEMYKKDNYVKSSLLKLDLDRGRMHSILKDNLLS